MQLLNFLLPIISIFTFAFATADPDSPVGASGSGDTAGTNSGEPVGSIAAASSGSATATSSTSTATSSSATMASTPSAAAGLLVPDWQLAGGLAVVVGGAAML